MRKVPGRLNSLISSFIGHFVSQGRCLVLLLHSFTNDDAAHLLESLHLQAAEAAKSLAVYTSHGFTVL